MLLEWPLIFTIFLIVLVLWKKGGDFKNSFLLLSLIASSVVYLVLIKPFSFEEELFILVGSGIIMAIVSLMVVVVQLVFGGDQRKGVRSYWEEIQRKAFHFVAFLMFVPWDVYRSIYVQGVVGFNQMFGTHIELLNEGFLTFSLFLVTYALLILFTIVESLRLLMFPKLFSKLLRPYEFDRFASYLYSTAAIFLLSVFMFPFDSGFAAALTIGFLADLAACLIGMKFRRFVYNDRSLEGGLANFLVGFLCGYYFIGLLAAPVALVIALFDFVNGALELGLNDNLVFPLLAGSIIKFFFVFS